MSNLTHFMSIWQTITSAWMILFASILGTPTDPGAPIHIYLPIVATQNDDSAMAEAAASTAPTIGMWLSAAEIAALPTTGAAWDLLKASADQSTGTPTLSDQDSNVNLQVLAKALVYARTGQVSYRNDVAAALQIIASNNTESGGRTLALGRELVAYVIAADLIDLARYDASLDTKFRAKLRELPTKPLDGLTLRSTQETRPNNWGTHAGAARTAVAIYLGDKTELDRAAAVFQGWLGNRGAYTGFSYGDLSWQADASKPVGINPQGATKQGRSIDGALPDDMRRGASFQWPPASTGYPWEGLQGAVVQAELLDRAGYPAWEWENRALLRAVQFLYSINWPAESDDTWQIWLVNQAYGTTYATTTKTSLGKNMSWTSWTHATASAPSTNQAPVVNAGSDTSILLSETATLNGTVSDDGRPNNRVTTTWSKSSGPGNATFGNANAAVTTVTFSQVGTYVLRLTANDGAASSSDEVRISVTAATINQAPVVNAGANANITLSSATNLDGTANDDGQPGNSLTVTWSQVSGPGAVTFGNANTVDTTATFSRAGVYILRLTASDGSLSTSDEVQITANQTTSPTNQAPLVNAGIDQTIAVGASANLDGTINDDGLPNPPATISATWSKISGPGNVVFGNANAVDTTATFSVAGTYTLRLSGSDSALTGIDEVNIVVATATTAPLAFTPMADAYVKSSSATSNYGTDSGLRLRNGDAPLYNSYLQFNVTGLSNAVQSAKLRLFVTDASKVGGAVYAVSNNFNTGGTPWTENGLTWNNAPAISGNPLSTLGTVANNTWIEFDVTAAVIGNGTYSFSLVTTSTDSAIYSAREGANPPQLVLTLNSGAPANPPTNQAPTVNAGTDASVNLPASINLDGSVSDDGLPSAALTTAWSKVSGPGDVAFGSANAIDTTATFSAAGVYVLRLTASDGAVSASDDVQITAGQAQGVLSLTQTADAHVNMSSPTRNYGTDKTFRLRAGSPAYYSYLQFTVSGLSNAAQSAKVRLYVTDESNEGGAIYSVANTFVNTNTPWTEREITLANAPKIAGTPLATLGAVQRNSWVEFDVTTAITGDGTYSFGLLTNSTNSVIYSSKEGANKPVLVLTTNGGTTSSMSLAETRVTTEAEETELTDELTDEALEQEWQANNANRLFLPLVQAP